MKIIEILQKIKEQLETNTTYNVLPFIVEDMKMFDYFFPKEETNEEIKTL